MSWTRTVSETMWSVVGTDAWGEMGDAGRSRQERTKEEVMDRGSGIMDLNDTNCVDLWFKVYMVMLETSDSGDTGLEWRWRAAGVDRSELRGVKTYRCIMNLNLK